MPDRTKTGRGTPKNLGYHFETEGEQPRTDLDQNVLIPRRFTMPLLDMMAVQSVGNQQAGPAAVFEQYRPSGKGSVTRPGLDGGDESPEGLPKSKKYTDSPNTGKRSNPKE